MINILKNMLTIHKKLFIHISCFLEIIHEIFRPNVLFERCYMYHYYSSTMSLVCWHSTSLPSLITSLCSHSILTHPLPHTHIPRRAILTQQNSICSPLSPLSPQNSIRSAASRQPSLRGRVRHGACLRELGKQYKYCEHGACLRELNLHAFQGNILKKMHLPTSYPHILTHTHTLPTRYPHATHTLPTRYPHIIYIYIRICVYVSQDSIM